MSDVPRKRFLLIIFAVCITLSLIFAGTFALTHLNHDCYGDECPVCLQIEIAQNILKGLILISLIILFAGIEGRAKVVKNSIFSYIFFPSPVLLKVKFTF
jgi:hypothetical protein